MKSMAHMPRNVEPLQTSYQPKPDYPEFTVHGQPAQDLMDHEPEEEYEMRAVVQMCYKASDGKDEHSARYKITHADFTPRSKKKKGKNPYEAAGDAAREDMKAGKY